MFESMEYILSFMLSKSANLWKLAEITSHCLNFVFYKYFRNAGFFPKRKYLLHQQKIAESTKSVDIENSQNQGLNSSYEEQSYESDLYKPKMDNARIRMMKESEFTNSTSYDKDISK